MGDRPTVLLGSRSELFITYLSILFNRMGFEVLPSESGMEILHVLRLLKADIVMLDANGENMEALRGIRNASDMAGMPVIMVSDGTDKALFDECVGLGCSAFLVKPVTVEELHRALQKNYSYRSGMQRRFLRANYNGRVKVEAGGMERHLFAVSLSERGIYVRSKDDVPVGAEVTVTIPLGGRDLVLRGKVIYKKGVYGELFKIAPGIAVFFDAPTGEEAAILKGFITELLVSDILEEQEERVIALQREAVRPEAL